MPPRQMPPSLPNGESFVQTPLGARPVSFVSVVPEGMRLHVNEDKEVVAIAADGTVHQFDQPSAEALAWLNDPEHPERRPGETGTQSEK